jgi:hypothetical protein
MEAGMVGKTEGGVDWKTPKGGSDGGREHGGIGGYIPW